MSNESIGISNLEINKFIKNNSNDDLESNFVGVYPSDKINFFYHLPQSDEKKRM